MNKEFEKELEHLINKYSIENETNTPDFILAGYVCNCLYILETTIKARDSWFKFKPTPDTRLAGIMEEMASAPREGPAPRRPGEKGKYESQS